jgi:hypothetical protein
VTVRELLAASPDALLLDADADLSSAYPALAGNPFHRAAVVRLGRLVGLVSMSDVARAARLGTIIVIAAACAALGLGGVNAGAARAATTNVVSVNWAGYAVTGAKYRRVTGSWTVPRGACTPGSTSDSAAWLGLGGFATTSRALEQIGTEFTCTSSGQARYSAWYELVPAPSVTIPMKVHAGDRVSASVTVSGTLVSLVLSNRTTGARFAKSLHVSAPDVTSAEWIVEAPSICTPDGACQVLALNNFGTTRFTRAHATSTGGHTGTPAHRPWTTTAITLSGGGASAIPSALTSFGSAFSVTYQPGAVLRNAAKRRFLS